MHYFNASPIPTISQLTQSDSGQKKLKLRFTDDNETTVRSRVLSLLVYGGGAYLDEGANPHPPLNAANIRPPPNGDCMHVNVEMHRTHNISRITENQNSCLHAQKGFTAAYGGQRPPLGLCP